MTNWRSQTDLFPEHGQELQRHFAEDGFKGVQSNSFYFRSIKPWNNLPRNVVDSPSIHDFKKRLNETSEKPKRCIIKIQIKTDSKRSIVTCELYFYNNKIIIIMTKSGEGCKSTQVK